MIYAYLNPVPITKGTLSVPMLSTDTHDLQHKAYQEHIFSLSMCLVQKYKMKRVVLVVNMTLEYPPHGDFKQYKKGQPHPRYSAKDKRTPRIQYNKHNEDIIKHILSL